MFSLDRFYNILHDNFVSQFPNGNSVYFLPFGTYDVPVRLKSKFEDGENNLMTPFTARTDYPLCCYFLDQEPLYDHAFQSLDRYLITPKRSPDPRHINIIAVSEKSNQINDFIKNTNFYSWYYFYHGFAALDWYRDFWYAAPKTFSKFDKVFICCNHLTAGLRSYRMHLVANLLENDIVKHGHVSIFPSLDWRTDSPLDSRAIVKVERMMSMLNGPMIIDTENPTGSLSSRVNLDMLTSGLWHVVTETVYFSDKLHLTEKVFKPIVAQRPFILVGAPGNLAYLKGYGFQTFDRWIDESYDNENDHYLRIELITKQIQRLCSLGPDQIKKMHSEMQEVLDYNHRHFYTRFRELITNELVDNFYHILCRINNGRQPNNHSRYHQRYDLSTEYLAEVKKRLIQ